PSPAPRGVPSHDGPRCTPQATRPPYPPLAPPAPKSRAAVPALGPYDHTEVIDDSTARVVFKAPNGAFLNNLAEPLFSPSSPAALQKYGADYGQHPVGTGPFVFKEWVADDHVTLVRNPAYAWPSPAVKVQGAALLDELVFRVIPDSATRVNALKSGDLDLAENLPPQDIAGFRTDPAFAIFSAAVTGMPYSIMVNATKAPTDDPLVRQALEFATNQEAIVDALYKGVY